MRDDRGSPGLPVLLGAGAMRMCAVDDDHAVEYIGLAAQRAAVQANGWRERCATGARRAVGTYAGSDS